ncbi:hypothetical protein [Glycomyces sp. MUSA5-2]|uniref:hypothetical protein n=1 Tax=Glycomyces sp. MUSA5-2 TaxID=2053002 RepID=UPI00300956AE
MSDRDAARPDGDAQPEPEPRPEAAAPEPAPEQVRDDSPAPELVEHIEPPQPVPDREPAPEPEAPAQHDTGPIEVEPHTSVEAVAEPAAPAQIAPEPGAAPIPFEPEPSVPEPPAPGSDADLGTADTLALPPTTAAVEPTPVTSSAPPPPTGVPVPFAAPPTERNGGRLALKLSLGIGGGFLLVTAVVVAVVVATATFTKSLTDEIVDTADSFIAELADEDWDAAYAMLCADLRDRPADDYIAEWESWDASTAEVQPLGYNDVDVRVRLSDGSQIALVVPVEQADQTIGTSICGWYDVTTD